MNSNWPSVKLGKHCIKIGSGATPRGGSNVYLDIGRICLIRSQNVYNDGFREDGLVYITDEAAKKLENVIVEENDVLINITGDSVARVCLSKSEYLPARVNQHVAIIRAIPESFDNRFIRYFLVSPTQQNYLLMIAAKGGTRNALTKGMLESLDIPKPDKTVQTEISNILQALDDKIEVNNQINQTLEEIAQAIFKSWFVDFDPVIAKMAAKANGQDPQRAAMLAISGKSEEAFEQLSAEQKKSLAETAALFPDAMQDSELGEIPKGWDEANLNSITEVKGGFAYKSKIFKDVGYPVIKIKNITGDGTVDLNDCQYIDELEAQRTDKFKLNDGDLVIAMTGATIGKVGIIVVNECNPFLNQRVAKFESSTLGKKCNWFLYCFLSKEQAREQIISSAHGSAQPNISTTGIANIKLILPQIELIIRFTDIVNPFFKKWIDNLKENMTLNQIRDALLPKLLSGEIELNNIEIENE